MKPSAGPPHHRPSPAGYAAGTLVAVVVVVVGLLLLIGEWGVLVVLYGAIPIVLLCAGAMGLTHLLTGSVVPQLRQVAVAAVCGALVGVLATAWGWVIPLLGAVALAVGRAVAIAWTGVRPPKPDWEERTYGR